jgi:carbon monoxide dehydrogenase subunit G
VNRSKKEGVLEFDNSFEVPLPVAEAWTLLMDIERIVPCVPGAELTEIIDQDNFKGKVSVRLGPVALTFAGRATFEERDGEAYSARVKAQGSDSKGRGGANADVTFRLVAVSDAATSVEIRTNLQLSGSVAQYGRGVGMITDVASQIIGKFADCLRDQVTNAGSPAGTTAAAPAQAAPVSMTSVGLRALWNALVRSIKKMFGASP